jgi:hypothetical protein
MERRKFIKNAATLTAITLLPPSAWAVTKVGRIGADGLGYANAGTIASTKTSTELRDYELLGLTQLKRGDIMHLQIFPLFTAFHSKRIPIEKLQKSALKMGKKDDSVYHKYKRQYKEKCESFFHKDLKDLRYTGHQTIYIGNGQVVEATGEGITKRRLSDIDTASYVVMRDGNSGVANKIADLAEALSLEDNAHNYVQTLQSACEDISSERAFFKELNGKMEGRSITLKQKYAYKKGSTVGRKDVTKEKYLSDEGSVLRGYIKFKNGKSELLIRSICSSFAAVCIFLSEKINKVSNSSIHIEPYYILPSYLHMGMELCDRYTTIGLFINLGSSSNKDRNDGRWNIVRPHRDYMDVTQEYYRSLSTEEAKKIQIPPGLTAVSQIEVIGHAAEIPLIRTYAKERQEAKELFKEIIEAH